MVGPNPAEGVFVEGAFLHPELDFSLRFPSEWKTQNQTQFVIAIPPEGDGKTAIVLALAEGGPDPVEAARADKLDENAMKQLERTQINGLRAARVVTEKQGSSFDLTWIAHGEHVYRIASVSPTPEFPRHKDAFRSAAQSFRPLRASDRAKIQEDRLRVRQSRAGESLEAFLERTRGTWSPEEAAIANGLGDDARLEGGQLLKVPISQRYTPKSQ